MILLQILDGRAVATPRLTPPPGLADGKTLPAPRRPRPAGPLSAAVRPMMVGPWTGWRDEAVWMAQPKLNGIRCLARHGAALSRSGRPIPGAAFLREALAPLFARFPDAVLDGELYRHTGDDALEAIRAQAMAVPPAETPPATPPLEYWLFDYPSEGRLAFDERLERLAEHLALAGVSLGGRVRLVEAVEIDDEAELDAHYADCLARGFEGQVAIQADALYGAAGGKAKRKPFEDAEFEVVAIHPGAGSAAGRAARVTCLLPNGRTFGAGIGLGREAATALLGQDHAAATLRFSGRTPTGAPRSATATAFHGQGRTL